MSKVCQVTGKRPKSGNHVSHSNIKTRRRSLPNIQVRRYWVPSEGKWVKLKLSTRAMRTIDKVGIDKVVARLRAQGERV